MKRDKKKSMLIDLSVCLCVVAFITVALILSFSSESNLPVSGKSNDNLTLTDLDVNKVQTKDDVMNAAVNTFLESIGLDKDDLNSDKTENGGTLVGSVAKTVKSYKTLAEAEEDMGYYLGFHNTLESIDTYELVGMYNIGDAWYQAIFSDSNEQYPDLTMKVSKTSGIESLIEAYKDNNYTEKIKNIKGIDVTFGYHEESSAHLVYFTTPNNKSYSIFTSHGLENEDFESIASELIQNIKNMDDWVIQ